ncbi:hypothetical protein Cni_G01671 [Canna indica]|uniref:Uncharacterized protein n=1 Tax=Canna indica TaxID=4628 RepID=A0AAQ3Q1C2_9LILI|nr:hypothetical protein Cni_G01671 [Canna indica]
MKRLGKGKRRRIQPAPPPGAVRSSDHHLAALPSAVLALAATLTAEEQEVLAYLLSSSGDGGKCREQPRRHRPELGCGCFGCYKSFWARWDASPNRYVIHAIIDAVEEELHDRELDSEQKSAGLAMARPEGRLEVKGREFIWSGGGHSADGNGCDDDINEEGNDGSNVSKSTGGKSSLRRFMSFIAERVWRSLELNGRSKTNRDIEINKKMSGFEAFHISTANTTCMEPCSIDEFGEFGIEWKE